MNMGVFATVLPYLNQRLTVAFYHVETKGKHHGNSK
jgi:hypothetical protein